MASHGQRPTLDLFAGRAALEEDLPRVLALLNVSSLEELSWRQCDRQILLIPIQGTAGGRVDDYLLKLHFRAGRAWPPSAQFVNPETLDYSFPGDTHHLPILQTPQVQVHTNYGAPDGRQMQLICCSATYEYYDVLHGGEDRHLWTERDTFYLTISAIQRAMGSSGYMGRHPRHGA